MGFVDTDVSRFGVVEPEQLPDDLRERIAAITEKSGFVPNIFRALEVNDRLVVAVEEPGLAPWVARVTMTLPVLNAGREVLFLVAGANKADAVHRAFVGPPEHDAPGSLIAPESGRLTVILDEAAAARLPAQAREGG